MNLQTAQQRLGRLIRQKRVRLYRNQKTFAFICGINLHHYNCIECGRVLPSTRILLKIAKALNTTLCKLLAEAWGGEMVEV